MRGQSGKRSRLLSIVINKSLRYKEIQPFSNQMSHQNIFSSQRVDTTTLTIGHHQDTRYEDLGITLFD